MLQAARKLKDQSLKEIDQLRKAKEFIRRHNGSQSRQAMVDRIITRLTSTRSQLDRNIGGLTRMELPSAGFDGKQLRPTSNEQFFPACAPGRQGRQHASRAVQVHRPGGQRGYHGDENTYAASATVATATT